MKLSPRKFALAVLAILNIFFFSISIYYMKKGVFGAGSNGDAMGGGYLLMWAIVFVFFSVIICFGMFISYLIEIARGKLKASKR